METKGEALLEDVRLCECYGNVTDDDVWKLKVVSITFNLSTT